MAIIVGLIVAIMNGIVLLPVIIAKVLAAFRSRLDSIDSLVCCLSLFKLVALSSFFGERGKISTLALSLSCMRTHPLLLAVEPFSGETCGVELETSSDRLVVIVVVGSLAQEGTAKLFALPEALLFRAKTTLFPGFLLILFRATLELMRREKIVLLGSCVRLCC